MRWIVQLFNGMLRNHGLQVIAIILMVMFLAEITISIGIFKVELYPTRCNRFFGTGWKAVNKKFDSQSGQAKAAAVGKKRAGKQTVCKSKGR